MPSALPRWRRSSGSGGQKGPETWAGESGQAAKRDMSLYVAHAGPQFRDFGLKGVIPQAEALVSSLEGSWEGGDSRFKDREGEWS